MDTTALKVASRSIRLWTGALAQSVYFAPECHERYVALGLDPPIGEWRGVLVGSLMAFHASRASVLGEVAPMVGAAAFPPMGPTVVIDAVERRQGLCDAATLASARQDGAVAQLRRILGPAPEGIETLAAIVRCASDAAGVGGRPFAAGLLSQGWSGDPLADAWHGSEVLRELRGDAHCAAWSARGVTPPQAHILTEHWYGLSGSGFRSCWGWSAAALEQANVDLAEDSLIDDGGLTDLGRHLRDQIEDATDDQMVHVMRVIAPDLANLAAIGERLSRAVVAGKGSLMVRPSYFKWLSAQPSYRSD